MINIKKGKGNDAFLKKFDNITKKFANKAIGVAVFRTSREMRNEAAKNAPYKKGDLRRSVTVEHKKLTAKVGSNKVYARIQDLGGQAGRGLKATIKGNKYLTNAFKKATEKTLPKYIKQEIKRLTK